MNTNVNGGSAKIYQFPAGGRASMSGQRGRTAAAANFGSQFVSEATSGSWYHDEAIRESQKARTAIAPVTFPRR
jgi:hypothetical protein